MGTGDAERIQRRVVVREGIGVIAEAHVELTEVRPLFCRGEGERVVAAQGDEIAPSARHDDRVLVVVTAKARKGGDVTGLCVEGHRVPRLPIRRHGWI